MAASTAPACTTSELALPDSQTAQQLLAHRRQMFAQHLAAWASDCLALRRRGIDQPVWTAACDDEVAYLADAA